MKKYLVVTGLKGQLCQDPFSDRPGTWVAQVVTHADSETYGGRFEPVTMAVPRHRDTLKNIQFGKLLLVAEVSAESAKEALASVCPPAAAPEKKSTKSKSTYVGDEK